MDGVKKILSGMTVQEKISLLSGKNNWQSQDLPDHGIDSFFMADGPCGLRKQLGKGDHLGIEDSVAATALVSGGCLAATWNPDRAKDHGQILGQEAAQEDVDVVLAPALNIVRSPLCGRNFEYFSEDPFLTGKIATAFTSGIQDMHVGACPKHFAANNQETEREYINVVADERTLQEIYLPAFEEIVKTAHPLAVMAALNQINGSYGAENHTLLTSILREEWGFDGIVISDWYGVVHRELAVKAGLDLEMPTTQGIGEMQLFQALQDGRLTEADIDAACERLLTALERICEERKHRKKHDVKSMHQSHHLAARRIAEEGIVMLKNEEGILPLQPSDSIAVIGPYAKQPKITLEGSARVICTGMDIPLDEMNRCAGHALRWAEGFRADAEPDLAELLAREAVALAQECRKAVYFMGQGDGVEKEGQDRTDLSLPAQQVALLNRIAAVNPNVVVVLSNASPVEMPWSDRAEGILECFLAGQGFGSAVARILYGLVNPSGKLPVTFVKRLEDTTAYLHFPGDGRTVHYSEGVFCGYRGYDKKKTEVLFPFGHGLSYTDFSYESCVIDRERFLASDAEMTVSVTIRNTGDRGGAETIQLYVGGFDGEALRPVRELKGFQKVYLEAGESREVLFRLTKRDFAYYEEKRSGWIVPEGEYRIEIGKSSRDICLTRSVYVEPAQRCRKAITPWSAFGEMKTTPSGKKYYEEACEALRQCMKEDTVFLKLDDLKHADKLDQLPMRIITLLTNGLIDNDKMLYWIDQVNRER